MGILLGDALYVFAAAAAQYACGEAACAHDSLAKKKPVQLVLNGLLGCDKRALAAFIRHVVRARKLNIKSAQNSVCAAWMLTVNSIRKHCHVARTMGSAKPHDKGVEPHESRSRCVPVCVDRRLLPVLGTRLRFSG